MSRVVVNMKLVADIVARKFVIEPLDLVHTDDVIIPAKQTKHRGANTQYQISLVGFPFSKNKRFVDTVAGKKVD